MSLLGAPKDNGSARTPAPTAPFRPPAAPSQAAAPASFEAPKSIQDNEGFHFVLKSSACW